MKAIAIKINYVSPRMPDNVSGITERRVITGITDKHKVHEIIEALQKRIKRGYVLDRLPSISWQLCDGFIDALVASNKL